MAVVVQNIARLSITSFFFFNDTATTEIYTLSLHDALPIYPPAGSHISCEPGAPSLAQSSVAQEDRKSTRLNSSHGYISYAVFCLKKKKKTTITSTTRPATPRIRPTMTWTKQASRQPPRAHS